MFVMKTGRSVADFVKEVGCLIRVHVNVEVNKIDVSQAFWFSKFSVSGRINGVKLLRIVQFGISKCGSWP